MAQLLPQQIKNFRKRVYAYYTQHKRCLPWRGRGITPYQIFVSEIMLQQTQVDRVVNKYRGFISTFENFRQLAQAPFSHILKKWQGLGYNRRALYLHKSAKRVMDEYKGRLPQNPDVLATFPGIGKATAASICAFAFNQPTVFIETNIRSVFIHHFFPLRINIDDVKILSLVAKTLDKKNPHRWYSALMDYGVSLKKNHNNPSRKSKHHTKQSRFEGSDRQIRGAIISVLTQHSSFTSSVLVKKLQKDPGRIKRLLKNLEKEGLIKRSGKQYKVFS
ncbi:MAG: A/G-specific adenine glycosylase [Candidatus Omnitrophica bacterium]|nr:A/G-specific adenine glycosylase [Candidatus Omnitrophota bacterium]